MTTMIGSFWLPRDTDDAQKVKGQLSVGKPLSLELSGQVVDIHSAPTTVIGRLEKGYVFPGVTLFDCLPTSTPQSWGQRGSGWQSVRPYCAIIGPGWFEGQDFDAIEVSRLGASIWPLALMTSPSTIHMEHSLMEHSCEHAPVYETSIKVTPYTLEIPDCEKKGQRFSLTFIRDASTSTKTTKGEVVVKESCGVTVVPQSGKATLDFALSVIHDLRLLLTVLTDKGATVDSNTVYFWHPEMSFGIRDYPVHFNVYQDWTGVADGHDDEHVLHEACRFDEGNLHMVRQWFRVREKFGLAVDSLCAHLLRGNPLQVVETRFHEVFVAVERLWSTWYGKKQSQMRKANALVEMAQYVGGPFVGQMTLEVAERVLTTRDEIVAHLDPQPTLYDPYGKLMEDAALLKYLGFAFLMKEICVQPHDIEWYYQLRLD